MLAHSDSLDDEKPVVRMAKSITMTNRQQANIFRSRFLDFALVTLPNPGFYGSALNEDGSLGSAIYGKIFGFSSRIPSLEKAGHRFRDRSNGAEFILHMYEERGDSAFRDLNGSFVAIVFGIDRPMLLLVTDRFGTRPAYYAVHRGELIFASHARGILSYPFPKKLDKQYLVEFLRHAMIGALGDRTWFEGIRLMPAGSILKSGDEGHSVRKYWDLEYSMQSEGAKEYDVARCLAQKFKKAVRMRVDSDVGDCCVMLSGGLDSRCVLGSLEPRHLQRMFAVTFGLPGQGRFDCEDVKIARNVCDALGIRHVVVDEYFWNDLEEYAAEVVRLTDGQVTIDIVTEPLIARRIEDEGASCFLQGYMFDLLLGGSYLWGVLGGAGLGGSIRHSRVQDWSEFIRILEKQSTTFSDLELERLLREDLRERIGLARQEFWKLARRSKGDTFANRADFFFINARVRRYTLMGSVIDREFVEELLPTIDNDVVEMIRRIPPELRYRHRLYRKFLVALDRKLAMITYDHSMIPPIFPERSWWFWQAFCWLLRQLELRSKGWIKTYVSLRRSYPSSLPLALRRDPNWTNLIRKTLLDGNSTLFKYLNRSDVAKLVAEHQRGIKDHTLKLITLMTIEIFLRSNFRIRSSLD
jgi:asparagine synthase (glutamine-hydrolysing)